MSTKSDLSGDALARLAYDTTGEALYVVEQKESAYSVLSVNRALCRLLDREFQDLVGQPLQVLWPSPVRQEVEEHCHKALRSDRAVTFEQELGLPSGTHIFQHVITRVDQVSDRVLLVGSLRDITSHKDRERIILRLSRMYALISQINQMVVRVSDRESLFRQACDIAVNFGQLRMAWVGLVDEKTSHVVPFCRAGHEEDYLKKMVRISTEEMGTGKGPTGSAIREGKHVICQDIARDPRLKPWREDALQRGYRSSIALPLFQNDEVIGSFNLYADEAFFFDGDEVRLLDEAAMDISFALQVLANEEIRKEKEVEVQKWSRDWELLTKATRKINSNLALSEILRVLVASALELTEAEQGTAGTMVEGKMVFTEITVKGQIVALDYRFEEGCGVPGWVMQHRKPYMTNDTARDPHVVTEIREKLQFYNLLDVPILDSGGELLGCFEIHNKPGGFDAHDIVLLENLAAAAAIAIQNADMMAKSEKSS